MPAPATQEAAKAKKPVDGGREAQRVLHWSGVVGPPGAAEGGGIVENSLVAAGDNAGESKVLMLKGRARSPDGFIAKLREWGGVVAQKMGFGAPRTLNQILAAEEFNEQFWKLRWAFVDSVESIMCCADPAQMADMMATTARQFNEQVKGLIARMSAGDADKAKALGALLDRMTAEADALKEAGGVAEKRAPLTLTLQELDAFDFPVPTADAAGDTGEPNTTEDAMTTAKTTPPAQDNTAETLKAMQTQMAEMATALKASTDANAALAKRLESAEAKSNALEADLVKEKGDKQDATFMAKAKKLAVGDNEVVKDCLKTAYGVSAAAGQKLEGLLEACSKQSRLLEKYTGKVVGLGHQDAEDGARGAPLTANDEVNEKAAALMKENTKLTKAAARKQVMDADPELKARAIARQ